MRGREFNPYNPASAGIPTFTSELGFFSQWIPRFARRSRTHAGVALLLSGGLLAAGTGLVCFFGPLNGEPFWSPGLAAIGLSVSGVGAFAVLSSVRSWLTPGTVRQIPTSEEFVTALGLAEKPLSICLSCHLELALPESKSCDECGSTSQVFRVETSADVRIVRAALLPEKQGV